MIPAGAWGSGCRTRSVGPTTPRVATAWIRVRKSPRFRSRRISACSEEAPIRRTPCSRAGRRAAAGSEAMCRRGSACAARQNEGFPQVVESLARASTVEAMSEPRYEKLQWTLEVLTRTGDVSYGPQGIEKVGANTYFAVRGQLSTTLPILYVLRVGDENSIVRIALMAHVPKLAPSSGSEVRLPQAGAYLVSQTPGSIIVLATERVLTREELAKLVGGRSRHRIATQTGPHAGMKTTEKKPAIRVARPAATASLTLVFSGREVLLPPRRHAPAGRPWSSAARWRRASRCRRSTGLAQARQRP